MWKEYFFKLISIKIKFELKIPTLCGILRSTALLKKDDRNCRNFEASTEMYQKFHKHL